MFCLKSTREAESDHKQKYRKTTVIENETLNDCQSLILSFPSSNMEVSASSHHSFGGCTNISPRLKHHISHKKEWSSENCGKDSVKRLVNLIKEDFPILILGMISAVAHGTVYPIFGFLFSKAIKNFYEPPNKLKQDSRFWALMYMILGIANLLIAVAQDFSFGAATAKLIKRLSLASFEKVLHQEICWFDDPLNSRCITILSLVLGQARWIVENLLFCLLSALELLQGFPPIPPHYRAFYETAFPLSSKIWQQLLLDFSWLS